MYLDASRVENSTSTSVTRELAMWMLTEYPFLQVVYTSVNFQLHLKGSDKHSPQNILIIFGREKVLTFDVSGASRSVSGQQQFRL